MRNTPNLSLAAVVLDALSDAAFANAEHGHGEALSDAVEAIREERVHVFSDFASGSEEDEAFRNALAWGSRELASPLRDAAYHLFTSVSE